MTLLHRADIADKKKRKAANMKEKCSNRGQTTSAPEGRRRNARDTAAKKQAHGETNGETLTDCKMLGAKYGLAAAECLARMNAAALQREREAHAATAREAASDAATLAQQIETEQMWQRYERRRRKDAEHTCGRLAVALDKARSQLYRAKKDLNFWCNNIGEFTTLNERKKSITAGIHDNQRKIIFTKWLQYRDECKGEYSPTVKDFLDTHGADVVTGSDNVLDLVKTEAGMRQFLKLHRQNERNRNKRKTDQKPKSGKR